MPEDHRASRGSSCPTAELKVAGGREVCLRDLQSWIFFAGADSTMIGNYLTTYGRKPEMDHQMVMDLGLKWRTTTAGEWSRQWRSEAESGFAYGEASDPDFV